MTSQRDRLANALAASEAEANQEYEGGKIVFVLPRHERQADALIARGVLVVDLKKLAIELSMEEPPNAERLLALIDAAD